MSLVLGLAVGCAGSGSSDTSGGALDANARVLRVVDGDTIVVEVGSRSEERVRLIGIDTPESVDPSRPEMCFGKEASARLAQLLPEGAAVQLVRDVEARDRYDRLLAYVYRASDGLFVNLELAREGYADLLTYPPNTAHVGELRDAVRHARGEGAGAWTACEAPFEE